MIRFDGPGDKKLNRPYRAVFILGGLYSQGFKGIQPFAPWAKMKPPLQG